MSSQSSERIDIADLPAVIPVFPLSRALLFPRATLPLNIFEPRYLAMVDHALSTSRIIGMVQPTRTERTQADDHPPLESVGCAGRIINFAEQPDGRYLITLGGVARFRIEEEIAALTPYRQARVTYQPFAGDLSGDEPADTVDRTRLLKTLADYLQANNLAADWDQIAETDTESLVNVLSMMSPFGAREKQALLEADSVSARCEVLIALTEMALARQGQSGEHGLQ